MPSTNLKLSSKVSVAWNPTLHPTVQIGMLFLLGEVGLGGENSALLRSVFVETADSIKTQIRCQKFLKRDEGGGLSKL